MTSSREGRKKCCLKDPWRVRLQVRGVRGVVLSLLSDEALESFSLTQGERASWSVYNDLTETGKEGREIVAHGGRVWERDLKKRRGMSVEQSEP